MPTSTNNSSHIALTTMNMVESESPNIWSLADNFQQTLTAGGHREGSIFSVAEAMTLALRLQRDNAEGFPPSLLGALISWRPTKGIYRFDETLYEALIDTDLDGDVPSEILKRLPGWAVYIETPESENMPLPIQGFWAYLSRLGKQDDLVMVGVWRESQEAADAEIDTRRSVMAYELPLGNHPISDLLELYHRKKAADRDEEYTPRSEGHAAIEDHQVSAMLSLVLYLCSEKPDIDNYKPPAPQYMRLGSKKRLLQSKVVREWDVGIRLGAALKKATDQHEDGSIPSATGEVGSVRPHVRRPHWHAFWVGKRGMQNITLRWLPPIPVNVNNVDKLPAVVRAVQAD